MNVSYATGIVVQFKFRHFVSGSIVSSCGFLPDL